MMSLGTMAAGVAHEINNPLLVITANSEFVELELRRALDEAGAPGQPAAPPGLVAVADQAASLQAEIRSAAQRIARIVSDLGVFSRARERVELRADLRRAVEWALRVTAHELRHRAETVVDLDPIPPLAIDEARLGQVLVNLLVNAALAIPSGRAEENSVRVRGAMIDDATAFIEVSDTGSGIAPEVLPRIFEPFFTTRGTASGTGLGLSVCHGIITAVGGQIDVESELGVGTCIRVELPVAAPKRSATQPATPIVPTRRARVLVIDDEEPILRAVRRGLGRHHDVVCTTRATEALALIDAGPAFDIIFSDLVMPNMTGMDFYDVLLRRHPEAASKVIFLTGGTVDEQLSGFLAGIPNRFFYKPIDLDVLLRAVDAATAE
jgi:CheY-like chemotaxis protein